MGNPDSQPGLPVSLSPELLAGVDPAILAQQFVEWATAEVTTAKLAEAWATLLPLLTADQRDGVAAQLKTIAEQARQSDLVRAGKVVELLFVWAAVTANPFHRALALRAQGNVLGIGQGKFREAIVVYDEAAQLYLTHDQPVAWAQTQIGKIDALANLGQCAEALALGEQAQQVFVTHHQWTLATYMASNIAVCIHARLDENQAALAKFTQALEFWQRADDADTFTLAYIEQNRGLLLRDIGRFDEALRANKLAKESFEQLGYTIEAARATQNIGEALALCGRYNEAIQHIDQARQVFRQDNRWRDVVDAEIVMCHWLLRLRRFQDVLTLCYDLRDLVAKIDAHFYLAETILQEASAYVGLGHYPQAILSLQAARHLCVALGHHVWGAHADLYEATVLYRQHEYALSLTLAQRAMAVMRHHAQPLAEAHAQLVAAQAALASHQDTLAHELVQAALSIAYSKDAPHLLYEGHYVQGKVAQAMGADDQALAAYGQAVLALERLQGHLMVEYRADFAADKQVVYEALVILHLQRQQTAQAFAYAERAKSRALLDLVARGLDLRITAKDPADQHLVEALLHLRTEQNRLYRSWEGRKAGEQAKALQGEKPVTGQIDWQPLWQEIRTLEQQIAALWNRLLVRNADYAREAALWQVRTENIQPDLADDTLLLEYFFAQDRLLLFTVTAQTMRAQTLACSVTEVEASLRFLQMNFNLAMRGDESPELLGEAQELLQELYDHLLAPLAEEVTAYRHLIIVPHGFLHKLPFHALYDGTAYLIERHTVSYLPSASLLRYCRRPVPPGNSAAVEKAALIAFGYNWQGALTAAEAEAQTIARLFNGVAYLDQMATLATFQAVAGTATLLHLATHGEFRADDALYSYLLLADGRLTTLDIFNLRLQASLVTLSACDTGQSLLGGGDELLGLLRAFLYAGAASLVLSHWRVDDDATRGLMELFYRRLAAGEGKAAALATAQRQWLISTPTISGHPYQWAAFFLVGDPGGM